MKRIFLAPLLLLQLALASSTRFSPDQYMAHIRYLASDELKGRGNNQPELEKAALYIEKAFRRAGLRPFPSVKGYRQFFEITAEIKVGQESRLQIGNVTYWLEKDFSLLSFSDRTSGQGEAIFCGYGITSADAGYDDYAGREVRGKVAVVRDGYPRLQEKQDRVALLSDTMSKIVLAKNQGAAALVIVREPRSAASRAAERMGITAFAVTPQLASALLGAPADQWNDPHASLKPTELHWRLQIEERRKKVANIVGYVAPNATVPPAQGTSRSTFHTLPFPFRIPDNSQSPLFNPQSAFRIPQLRDPQSTSRNPQFPAEWIVVGAHYDHLGLGEKFALDPNAVGQPHNGADDNASGTAGVLCLAQAIAARPAPLRRGVIFVTFAGEELGLLGSNYFVKHLPTEAQRVTAMINMDMVGRAQGKIYLGGVGTAIEFRDLLKDLHTPLKIEVSQSGLGGSDHMSFTSQGIPSLFFFSGLHSDYHKATDDWQKIDAAAAMEVLDLVDQVIEKLAASAEPLHFASVAEPKASGGGSGYGAYFGSVPDFAQDVKGVRFADVREGSPAQKAGLKAGDVLIKFDGKPIENLYDFTYMLRSHAPGDVVEVEVTRGGGTLKANVTLGKRQ